MIRRRAVVGLVVWMAAWALGAGCKGEVTAEKYCQHVREALGSGEGAECQQGFERVNRRCGNAQEVLSCMLDGDSEAAMEACEVSCDRSGARPATSDQLCAHLREVMVGQEIGETQCAQAFQRINGRCLNSRDVLDCAMEARDGAAMAACDQLCQHGGEGTGAH